MEMQTLLQAFLAPDRLRILGALAEGHATATELAARLKLKPADVARHIATLRAADLLEVRPDGAFTLNETALRQAAKELRPAVPPAPILEAGDEWELKVLRTFLVDGDRIREMPTSLKRQLVIFKWLSTKFEPGRCYPEAEVNELIKQHHPDFATLRRALVDHRLMDRENQVYWRVVS